jgi:hypothetical protein
MIVKITGSHIFVTKTFEAAAAVICFFDVCETRRRVWKVSFTDFAKRRC